MRFIWFAVALVFASVQPALAQISKIDDTSSSIIYSGSWGIFHDINDYNGTEHYSVASANSPDASFPSASFTFTGTQITWIGKHGPDYGIAYIYLDGALVGIKDSYSSVKAYQQTNYSNTSLILGSHTIKIVVTNRKNAASSNYYQVIDAIVYGRDLGRIH